MTNSANGHAPESFERAYSQLDWVTVKKDQEFLFNGPVQVVHDTGDRVWGGATYADELPDEVVQVGDGLNNGYDYNGNKIVSVPAEWCTFMDDEEAHNIALLIQADEQLLSYAR